MVVADNKYERLDIVPDMENIRGLEMSSIQNIVFVLIQYSFNDFCHITISL